jgi:hypothetical protein
MQDSMTEELYEVLNPRGTLLPVTQHPLSQRFSDLRGKKIYFVDLGKPESDTVFDALEKYLPEFATEAQFIRRKKEKTYFMDEPELWIKIEKDADAFIFGVFD